MRKQNVYFLFVILSLCLIIVSVLSILYGSKSVDMEILFDAFFTNKESFSISVVQARIPRTLFGILAGASLGVSGCLMQSITRNPIADPSILGINTGASLFVVVGIAFFSISSPSQYIWLGFTGAMLTAILVYGTASVGQSGATPIKLALAGAAVSMALMSLVNTIMLPNSQVMDSFRFWQTGSIGGAKWNMILVLLPYFILGLLLSFYLSSYLNTLALGDELATSLGINSKKVRAMAAFAGVLLCGATTALAGPIAFVGLMVPHIMRLLIGSNMHYLLPLSALGGSILLLGADIIGRVIASPAELEVGIITAILGAPVFIYIVRKVKIRSL
nr:iron chelate uptake ABC transporter family permease subunit [uncultured Merdimonas sp.]